MSRTHAIGESPSRIDGLEKITGAARYVDDLDFGPDLLHAAIVESPHAHARILSIDTAEAEAVPGVVRVVTGKDFPYNFGLYMHDRYVFAQDRVRFVGEQVGAVIARCPKVAKRAAKLVKVQYEPLPAILDQVEAIAPDAPLLHPDLGSYFHVPWFFPRGGTNIAHWRKVRRGDVEQGFAEADFVLEDTYRVPRYAHCAIEPHVVVGHQDYSGRVTLYSASQSPFTQRNLFAQALGPVGLSHKDIRVVTPYVGGGFGGKAGVTMEILGAVLATVVKGHPIKLRWTREQEFYNTYQRLGAVAKLKVGVKRDGTITAMEHTLYWDAGAYVEYGANVVNAAGLSATGPYRVPNVKIDSVCVYTNLPPCGAYRGFGYPEILWGVESHMTRIAHHIGMDPVEFRRRNAIREGDTLPYGAPMNPNGLGEAIDRVAEAIGWGTTKEPPVAQPRTEPEGRGESPQQNGPPGAFTRPGERAEAAHTQQIELPDPDKARGKGFALFWKAPAMPPNAASSAFLKFNEDGSVGILASGMEIGQGYLTVMAQIASEILSVPVSKIRVETPDTDRSAYEWQTVGSHVTWGSGNAVKKAALEAREKIFDTVARALCFEKDTLYLEDEHVKCRTHPGWRLALRDFVINGIQGEGGFFKGGPILASGVFMPEFTSAASDPETGQGGHPNVHYTVGAAAAEIEVDRQTGKVRVKKVVLAVDAGKAINPTLIKGQITGGIVQGLATVLYEEMRFDANGKLINPTFTDYKLPTAMDVPAEIVPIILEVPQPEGPFGARGVGEHTMIPVAPMIANAVEDAVGVRIKSMPVTAEKIALAIALGDSFVESWPPPAEAPACATGG